MSAKRPQKGSSKLQAFQDLKDDIWFHDIEVRRSYFRDLFWNLHYFFGICLEVFNICSGFLL